MMPRSSSTSPTSPTLSSANPATAKSTGQPSSTSTASALSVPIPAKILSGWTHRGNPTSRRLARGTHLGAIDENGGMSPDRPTRSQHRPMARMLNFGFPPTLHASRHPPEYSEYNDIIGPHGEKFADLRRNRTVPRRGGWVRLASLGLILLLILIALGVGLGVGLTRKKTNGSPPNPSPVNAARPAFPAGSYSFTTFLDSISTACTPNSATWQCYPYETYNESSSGSEAVFNWDILPSDSSSGGTSQYLISSSNNPFALTFTNATLSLINQGTVNEAYSFSVPMQKIVVPTVALTSDDATTECYYNHTMFEATLYTRKAKTYPAGSPKSSGQLYGPWPYAVQIEEIINAGPNVPECYKVINGVKGDKVNIGIVPSARNFCACLYQNYGT